MVGSMFDKNANPTNMVSSTYMTSLLSLNVFYGFSSVSYLIYMLQRKRKCFRWGYKFQLPCEKWFSKIWFLGEKSTAAFATNFRKTISGTQNFFQVPQATPKRCKFILKLIIKTPKWNYSGVYISKSEHISYLFISYRLLNLSRYFFAVFWVDWSKFTTVSCTNKVLLCAQCCPTCDMFVAMHLKCFWFSSVVSANKYMFKVNNRNTGKRCEICFKVCNKDTITLLLTSFWCLCNKLWTYLIFLLLTLTRQMVASIFVTNYEISGHRNVVDSLGIRKYIYKFLLL